MKRYIRIKDKIMEKEPGKIYLSYEFGVYQDEIREADIIEELCDAFVSVFKDDDKFVETDFEKAWGRFAGHEGIRRSVACFGAIWKDEGLIYVAKMNDKRELELI